MNKEEMTTQDRIKRLTTQPDWVLVEELLISKINDLLDFRFSGEDSNEVIARNVVASKMAIEVLQSFLYEVEIIKRELPKNSIKKYI